MNERKQQRYLAKKNSSVEFYTLPSDSLSHKIHYSMTGNEEADFLVLFVHGSPGSSSNFIDFLGDSALQEKALLISVDRPGFGGSRPRGRAVPSLKEQASLLAPILEQYPNKQSILVGHSWGGPTIGRLACDYPQLVNALVFVAASVDPELEPGSWYRPILHFPLVRWILPGWARASNRELMFAVEELTELSPCWSTINCPTYILQGEKDKLVPSGNAQFLMKEMTSASPTLEIEPELNHFIPWTSPDLIQNGIFHLIEELN